MLVSEYEKNTFLTRHAFLIFKSFENKGSDEYFKMKGVVVLQVLLLPW